MMQYNTAMLRKAVALGLLALSAPSVFAKDGENQLDGQPTTISHTAISKHRLWLVI